MPRQTLRLTAAAALITAVLAVLVTVTEGIRLDAASEIVADEAGKRALDGGIVAAILVTAVITVPLAITLPGVTDALLLGGAFPLTV